MSFKTWDLETLRKYVQNKYSNPQLYLAQIHSIDRTVGIFIHHMSSAKKLIDKIEPKCPKDAIELIFTPKEKRLALEEIKLGIQAETQATAHNARSIHDMFSQLANSLLVTPPMKVSECDINKLKEKLPSSMLKNNISNMLESDEYFYINAFINTIKHRSLVGFGATIDTQEGKGGIKFHNFKYREKEFKALWAVQVIENALEVKNQIIVAGNLLNIELGIT